MIELDHALKCGRKTRPPESNDWYRRKFLMYYFDCRFEEEALLRVKADLWDLNTLKWGNKRMKKKEIKICLVLILLLSSCMSVIRPKDADIRITSEPSGAIVFYNGQQAITPTILKLPRGSKGVITFEKDGYGKKLVEFNAGWSFGFWTSSILLNATHGLFTIFISTVIGVGIDSFNGVNNDFEEEQIHVILDPLNLK